MDHRRFAQLARVLAARFPRRSLAGGLGIGLFGGASASVPCSKPGGKCAINGDCCGPFTRCKRRAVTGKCRCRAGHARCAAICCPAGQACCGRCADLQTDPNNCGACFTICASGESCVAGICTL